LGSGVEITPGFGIFADVMAAFQDVQPGVILITATALLILITWDHVPVLKKLKLVPGALVAVLLGVGVNEVFIQSGSSLAVTSDYLVNLPIPASIEDFKNILIPPNFGAVANPSVWV